MKKLLAPALVLAAALWMGVVAGNGVAEPPTPPPVVTLKGEVVELMGYLTAGKRGPEFSEQAEASIRGGASAGLLTADGTVYLILISGNEGREPLKFVGHNIELKGQVHERGGMKGLVTLEVTDAGPAEAPKPPPPETVK